MEGFWKVGAGRRYRCLMHGVSQANATLFFRHLRQTHHLAIDEALEVLYPLTPAAVLAAPRERADVTATGRGRR